MKAIAALTVALICIALAAPAFADCTYQGHSVPTGTNIGGVVCQPDGSWK